MKKAICFILAFVLTFGCFSFTRAGVSAAGDDVVEEKFDVEFSVEITAYDEAPASGKAIVFTNNKSTERIIKNTDYSFSSIRVFIFNSEGRMIEAGENIQGAAQTDIVIPAGGFMLAFGSGYSTNLNRTYTTVFEGAVLYNATMSVICEAYGYYDTETDRCYIKYNRPAPESEDCISFLFVGNSSTYFNGTPLKFKAVCRAAGIEVSVTYCTFGSAYLSEFADETHERGKALRNALNSRAFDYVVLQEAASDSYSGMKAALDVILPLVEANGAKPLLYMRYSDSTEGCKRHYDIYTRISKLYGIPYSPVCVAFEYCRLAHPEINLYASDGGHHSKAGSYIAACTWLYSFFGVSPIGNAYLADMPETTARILQEYAVKAVDEPFAYEEPEDTVTKNGFTYTNVALERPYVPVGDTYSGKWTDTGADGQPIGKFTDGVVTKEGDNTAIGCYKSKTMNVTIDLGEAYALAQIDTDLFGGTWGIPDPANANVRFEYSSDGENFAEVSSKRTSPDRSYGSWSRVYFWSEPAATVAARYVRVTYLLDPDATNTFCWISEIRAYGVKRGAFDSDEEITSDDAIYLLRYTLFPGGYPICQNGDIDGDGDVDSDDAIYLLRFTLFPESYPLK